MTAPARISADKRFDNVAALGYLWGYPILSRSVG